MFCEDLLQKHCVKQTTWKQCHFNGLKLLFHNPRVGSILCWLHRKFMRAKFSWFTLKISASIPFMLFNSYGDSHLLYTVAMWSHLLHCGLDFHDVSLYKANKATYPPNAPSRTAKTPKSELQQLPRQSQWQISGASVFRGASGCTGFEVWADRKFQSTWKPLNDFFQSDGLLKDWLFDFFVGQKTSKTKVI